ncbi:MAG: hypothetical protein UHG68_07455 [Clostridia bacterium]|nr:hypothetical protein [Clostridia bacterium]
MGNRKAPHTPFLHSFCNRKIAIGERTGAGTARFYAAKCEYIEK